MYYSKVWERMADWFGGVNRETKTWKYKSNSLAWVFLKIHLGYWLFLFICYLDINHKFKEKENDEKNFIVNHMYVYVMFLWLWKTNWLLEI